MKRRLLITAFFLLVISGLSSVRAAQTVWSGLVIANNVGQPSAAPAELRKIEQSLKNLFGYNQFNIIGQSSKVLKTGDEDWLASSKYFSLHVDSKAETADGYLVNLK